VKRLPNIKTYKQERHRQHERSKQEQLVALKGKDTYFLAF